MFVVCVCVCVCFKVLVHYTVVGGGPSEECRDMSPEEETVRRVIDSDTAF